MSGSAIETRVLDSNPILEAFGNASTPRNDNSSRFGKFIQLQFDRSGQIVGGVIRTYLLEKTRVIHQGQGERNFHIFYQLSDLLDDTEIPLWLRGVKQEVEGINDAFGQDTCVLSEDVQSPSLMRTVTAMKDIGISQDAQVNVFKLLVAILHLSQIHFVATARDQDISDFAESTSSDYSKVQSSRLLGVLECDLHKVLLYRDIVSGRDARRSVYVKPVTVREARSRRDCLAMLVYARLFDWLVSFINFQIRADSFSHVINLLDIYGFETLEVNSLEQLCINYANERLQQHYVGHFLHDLQVEYEAEMISWVSIDYHDNRPCVEALHAPTSVFGVLNEDVCLNRQSPSTELCERLITSDHSGQVVLHLPGGDGSQFVVSHYAGEVIYSLQDLVQKNKVIFFSKFLNVLNVNYSCFSVPSDI